MMIHEQPAEVDFLHDPHESRVLKSLLLAVLGFGPVDDVLLPGLGFVDDLPTIAVAGIAAIMTINRVRHHR